MLRTGFAIVCLALASTAAAQCDPAGRSTFVAGLEALSRGELDTARTSFESLVQAQPGCAEARNNLAVILVEQGHPAEAAEQLRQALKLNPEYQRARANLQRVDELLASERQAKPPSARQMVVEAAPAAPSPVPTAAAPAATVVPTAKATVVPTATAAAVAAAEPTAPAAARVPPNLAELEPEGATACVVDPPSARLCLYRRTGDQITPVGCYGLSAVQVSKWPPWVVPSEMKADRMRFIDVNGRRQFRVVPQGGAVLGDTVQLRPADYTALAAAIVPWRTGWLVLDSGRMDPQSAADAARQIREVLERWRQSWEDKQFDSYAALYSSAFVPADDPDLERWRTRKRYLFQKSGKIAVQIAPPSIYLTSDGAVITAFEQRYRSDLTMAYDFKALRWQREGGGWRITAETVLSEQHP